MTRLPRPLLPVLKDRTEEEAIARMWRGISKRRAAKETSPRALLRVAAVSMLAALALLFAGQAFLGTSEVAHRPGPLVLMAGGAVPITDVPSHVPPAVLTLADASRLTLDPGTRLEPLASSGTQFVVALRRGRATFEVTPGGPREWIVEAGPVSVQVVGTRFAVTRNERSVKVSVERGTVLVRGSLVPGDVQRLGAGQEIEIVANPSADTSSAPRKETGHAERTPASPAKTGWFDEARHGRYQTAYRALGPGGVRRSSDAARSVEELLALADVARLSGHPAEAVAPLHALLRRHPTSAHAPLAAVTLGRVELDALGNPRAAASAFERALALGPPAGLEEDILVRLIEAHSRSGERSAAKARAVEYASRFPEGRRRNEVPRWLGPD